MKMELTPETIKRILEVVDAGLSMGIGTPSPGHMCVEAAICYAMDLPHDDKPPCVADVLRDFKIALNDSDDWSSNKARAKGLRRLAIAQLGTKNDFNSVVFNDRVVELTIKVMFPRAIRAYCNMWERVETLLVLKHLNRLRKLALECEKPVKMTEIFQLCHINNGNLGRAARTLYENQTAQGAVEAIKILLLARMTTSGQLCRGDDEFSLFAEEVVKILVDMKTPGSAFLYLTE